MSMNKLRRLILVLLVFFVMFSCFATGPRTVYVRGYYRRNGTYVHSYYRSRPSSHSGSSYSSYGYYRGPFDNQTTNTICLVGNLVFTGACLGIVSYNLFGSDFRNIKCAATIDYSFINEGVSLKMFILRERKVGLFFGAEYGWPNTNGFEKGSSSVSNPDVFYFDDSSLSESGVLYGDFKEKSVSSNSFSFLTGVTYGLSNSLWIYGGAGMSFNYNCYETGTLNYSLTDDENYSYSEDVALKINGLNLSYRIIGGFLYNIKQVALTVSGSYDYIKKNSSISVGIGYMW